MSFTVNYDEVTEFPLLDVGTYDAILHSVRKETGDAGTFLATRFSIIGDELNRQAWINLSLAKNSMWKIRAVMKNLGLADGTVDYKSRQQWEQAVIDALPGAECKIEIYHENFEDEPQQRIGAITAR